MTVAELIAELQKLPQDAVAVTAGYEGGWTEAERPAAAVAGKDEGQSWYYGEFVEGEGNVSVVHIPGRRH